MLFDPAPLRTAGPARHCAERLALTLLGGSSPDGLHENQLRTLAREDRLREQENQRRRAALDASTPLASPADVIRCGERRMEIGSRAFERGQVRRHAGEQATATRNAFREALHEARRPHDEVRSSTARPSSEHGVKTAPPPCGGRQSVPPAAGGQLHSADPAGRPEASPGPHPRGSAAPAPSAPVKVPFPPPAAGNGGAAQASAAKIGGVPLTPAAGQLSGPAPAARGSENAGAPAPAAARSESGGPRVGPAAAAARPSVRPEPLRAGPVSRPPQAESAEQEARIERIVRLLRSELGRERSRATLRLDPPELGTIRMHIDLQKDRLLLRVDTQSDVAHRLLTEDVEALRAALAQSGIHLEKAEIRPPPQPFDPPTEAGAHSPSQQGSGRQDADRGETGRPEREVGGGGQHLPAGAGERPGGDETQPAAEPRLNLWA